MASLEQVELLIYICRFGTTPVLKMLGVVNGRACKGKCVEQEGYCGYTLQRTGEMILLVLARFSTHIMTVCLVEDVRLRWRTLRDCYVREIRKKKHRLQCYQSCSTLGTSAEHDTPK